MNTDLIMALLSIPSPSGHELKLLQFLFSKLSSIVESEVTISDIGLKFQKTLPGKSRVYVLCHVDEVAVEITSVDNKGRFVIKTLGNIPAPALLGSQVAFYGQNTLGIILPLNEINLYNEVEICKDFYVEIEDSQKHCHANSLKVGNVGYIVSSPKIYKEHIRGKGLDNKIGVAIVVEFLMRCISSSKVSLTVIFTCKEEIKLSRIPEEIRQADHIVVIDAASTVDKVVSGGGVVINHTIKRPNHFTKALVKSMRAKKIMFQEDTINDKSGTEADLILKDPTFASIPITVLSYPVTFLHTPFELVNIRDVETTFLAVMDLLTYT